MRTSSRSVAAALLALTALAGCHEAGGGGPEPDADTRGGSIGADGGAAVAPDPAAPIASPRDAGVDTAAAPAPRADAGPVAADAVPPRSDGAAPAAYSCNLVLGIATTHEWFTAGFEKVVDNARWEIVSQDSAHIEKWADPKNAVWSLPKTSACAANADAPDRIVFNATNYDYTTVAQFLPKYLAVIENIKNRYPSARRIDLMTYTRAPGNVQCTAADRPTYSYIKSAQDEAASMVVAMFPGFVFAAPRWEVKSCADFTLCPHLTGTANAAVARTIADHFLAN
jgi:hypothetical protein